MDLHSDQKSISQPTKPSLTESIIPIAFLIGIMTFNVLLFESNATYGPNQIALILTAALAVILAIRRNHSWAEMFKGMLRSIQDAMPAILILMVIGAVIGTWMVSGIVPSMIYYGLDILSPNIFLVAAVVISAVVSVATGSSWTTSGTIGIALMGIGTALGINPGMIAGAVISGAYFGDKLSPLSDTTNLAPAMAGTDLFTHIRYMMFTTVPNIMITLIIFLVLGLSFNGEMTDQGIIEVQQAISSKVNVTPWLFVVPIGVIIMIAKKIPAIPALIIGAIGGSITALIFQIELLRELGQVYDQNQQVILESQWRPLIRSIINAWSVTVEIHTNNAVVDELLRSKGMVGMMNTIWLIICAMIFGGTMDAAGYLKRISESIMKLVSGQGSLVTATAVSCGFMNATASDQYISIVVPGRMFRDIYQEKDLAPENLSRTLEDAGTVTGVLVPWNTCGSYQSSVLGVATGQYWFYCFFNLISPFLTITFAYLNIKIRKLTKAK